MMISILLWVLGGLLVLLPISGMMYRALRQHRTSKALAFQTPHGITQGHYVLIGGIEQRLQIRGEDRHNPILLVVGGHGLSMGAFTPLFRSWEQYFTVALWDRRGTGKTMSRNGKAGSGTWTLDRLIEDGIEVTEFLCQHLRKTHVVLLGHSQGSALALSMVKRRPDLFSAYVGTGQIVDLLRNEALSYQTALERARTTRKSKALKVLLGIGSPPYPQVRTWLVKQRWCMETAPEMAAWQALALRLMLFAPNYSLRDLYHAFTGVLFLPQRLYEEYMAFDARRLLTSFEVPCFVFQGALDVLTPTALVEDYMAEVSAPTKEMVLLEEGGHMALLLQSEQFLQELLRPLSPVRLLSLEAAPGSDL